MRSTAQPLGGARRRSSSPSASPAPSRGRGSAPGRPRAPRRPAAGRRGCADPARLRAAPRAPGRPRPAPAPTPAVLLRPPCRCGRRRQFWPELPRAPPRKVPGGARRPLRSPLVDAPYAPPTRGREQPREDGAAGLRGQDGSRRGTTRFDENRGSDLQHLQLLCSSGRCRLRRCGGRSASGFRRGRVLVVLADLLSLCIFLSLSLPSRRTWRMAFARPRRVLRLLTSSLRRSSVSGGMGMRITLPSVEGFRPRSELRIAFSTADLDLSHGSATMRVARAPTGTPPARSASACRSSRP